MNLKYTIIYTNFYHVVYTLSLFLLMLNSCNRGISKTLTDIDGNVYETVSIGDQVWMTENLKTTRYQNGDTIQMLENNIAWINAKEGAYCYYANDTNNLSDYGLLYNWYAVTDERNICPKGWHLPSINELLTLLEYLGDDVTAAGKMKVSGTGHWLFPNTGATNESGFGALPGGYRFNYDENHELKDEGGTFHTLGSNGYWWTTTESFQLYSWTERIFWGYVNAQRNPSYKTFGLSVRCLKD